MRWIIAYLSLLAAVLLPVPVAAQEREVPYWASMRAPEVNMRVGPSQDYPIEWVYKRQGLPVKVLRVREGWRLISDPDGTQGWVVARLLNPERGALVIGEGLAAIRAEPSDTAQLKWNAQPGVVGKLGRCEAGWCKFDVGGRSGWIRENRLWGVGEP
ncbi:MAG: SH3 domain-containing protein [Erythrobacter sp.]